MAITKKPKQKLQVTENVDVEALIRKGGSVAGDAEPAEKITPLVLRLPPDVLGQVDEAVKARRLKTPRHTWLLEAVLEKLDRENKPAQPTV